MSTTGLSSWAVDLKDIAAVYPFQGTEVILTVIGLATWIGWHIWCIRWEKNYQKEKIEKYGDAGGMKDAVDTD